MYVHLKPLVKWTEREQLVKTIFGDIINTVLIIIINCFEVFIERPINLKVRTQTWSNYKYHNTIKFLISIAPQGAITLFQKGGEAGHQMYI